ncbi:hypothetical protein BX616_009674 [Lobosporangium transversale]|nr:hypothetical protein BX616_009674 [Lobosporangium transversale]
MANQSDHSLPKDTLSAIHYLLDLLHPSKVKQQKVFPRVCLIHQIYSIIDDHTTVDRTLAQLIKDGTIRKFYLGGTGSDEFAIMLTSDYVTQIEQAKEQYLKDLQETITISSTTSSAATTSSHNNNNNNNNKRKIQPQDRDQEQGQEEIASQKRTTLRKPITRSTISSTNGGASEPLTSRASPIRTSVNEATTTGKRHDFKADETIFDRFKDLVTSGRYFEISIQHSNMQSVIGATDEDITTLIRYSLLNRSLSVPANPHLVNLNQPIGRGGGGGGDSTKTNTTGGGHTALNQLIHATNQEQAKAIKSETTATTAAAITSSVSTASAPSQTTTISAVLGRHERVTDDVSYRFAIRQGGLFVTHLLKGRLEMLRMIRRQTFGDMLTSALVSKPLRGSFLPHKFHIHDIIGSGRVQR